MRVEYPGQTERIRVVINPADATSAVSTALQDVPNFSFPVDQNDVWEFDAYCQCGTGTVKSGGAGVKFGVNGPTAMTVAGQMIGTGAASTVLSASAPINSVAYAVVSALNTAYGPFIKATLSTASITERGYVHMHCRVSNGTNPGTVQIRFRSDAGGPVTVSANSMLRAIRVLG